MSEFTGDGTTPRGHQHARDLQARLYREIGISAVAAALRCTTRPDPTRRAHDAARPSERPETGETLAA